MHSRRAAKPGNGFTLIELMIVVVIVGVLAAIALPRFGKVSRGAKESEAVPILKQLYTLQGRFKQKTDGYATTIADLEGGAEAVGGASYYEFSMTSDGSTGFCVSASQKAAIAGDVVSPRSIDQDRNLYGEADCSGAILSGPDAS